MDSNFNCDFDPDFSEYNPIFAEIRALKEQQEKHEEGFLNRLIQKLTTSYIFITN